MFTRRQIVLLAAVVVAISAIAIILPRFLAKPRDIRSALAVALHIPKERIVDFFLNLPPASSRYPGAILVGKKLLVLEPSTANDTGFLEGQHFTLTASDSAVAGAAGSLDSTLLRSAARDSENVSLELTVNDGKVLELPVSELKRRLIDSESAKSAANKGVDPLVIDRAYVGTLEFVLRGKSDAGAKLLANIAKSKELAVSTTASLDASRLAEGEIKLTLSAPVVFAFEVSAASYITTNLGVGPSDVNFRRIGPDDISKLPASPSASHHEVVPWTLATVSSGYYPALQTLTQSWNASSADLVENALSYYHPAGSLRLRATQDTPVTEKSIDAFISTIANTAARSGSHVLVFYYIGHTVSWPNGDVALVLGDATAIPRLERSGSNTGAAKQFGEQIGNLARLADTLQANSEKLPPGYLPLREVYASLEKTNSPFLLAIDGCLRNDDFEKFRESLGIVSNANAGSFFFVGADQQLLSNVSEFDSHLRHFADGLPYLHSTNPVILAAKPGTFAIPAANPALAWEPAGPLAWRIAHYVRSSLFDASPPTLADVFFNISDYKGTGEVSPKGSISWSDFSEFQKLAGTIEPRSDAN
jgi:hypothetical protein